MSKGTKQIRMGRVNNAIELIEFAAKDAKGQEWRAPEFSRGYVAGLEEALKILRSNVVGEGD